MRKMNVGKSWVEIRRTYSHSRITLRDLRFNDHDRRERDEGEQFFGDEYIYRFFGKES